MTVRVIHQRACVNIPHMFNRDSTYILMVVCVGVREFWCKLVCADTCVQLSWQGQIRVERKGGVVALGPDALTCHKTPPARILSVTQHRDNNEQLWRWCTVHTLHKSCRRHFVEQGQWKQCRLILRLGLSLHLFIYVAVMDTGYEYLEFSYSVRGPYIRKWYRKNMRKVYRHEEELHSDIWLSRREWEAYRMRNIYTTDYVVRWIHG